MQEKDFINAQDFILACKMDWTKSKYSSLRERFFEKQNNSDAILSVSDVEKLFEDDLDYQIFGQKFGNLDRLQIVFRHLKQIVWHHYCSAFQKIFHVVKNISTLSNPFCTLK